MEAEQSEGVRILHPNPSLPSFTCLDKPPHFFPSSQGCGPSPTQPPPTHRQHTKELPLGTGGRRSVGPVLNQELGLLDRANCTISSRLGSVRPGACHYPFQQISWLCGRERRQDCMHAVCCPGHGSFWQQVRILGVPPASLPGVWASEILQNLAGGNSATALRCQPPGPLGWRSRVHDGEAHAGIVPRAGNPLAAAPAREPPEASKPSPPPTLPRLGGAKLPAASKAYCSAVTRNGCRSTGRERLETDEGRGGASRGDVS